MNICVRIVLIILFALTGGSGFAQNGMARDDNGAEEVLIKTDSLTRKIEIQFECDQPVNNLLVMVNDSIGQTVFLETKYGFQGAYKHTVNLQPSGKGRYYLKIIKDEIRISRVIDID